MAVSKRLATSAMLSGRSRSVGVEGLAQLVKNLDTLKDRTVYKATKAGINHGMNPVLRTAKAIVTELPQPRGWTDKSWERAKRAARKTLKKRLKKYRGKWYAKCGFGVGKQTKVQKSKAAQRYDRYKAKKAKGVGISSTNIHWFVLGTDERSTKRGHPTGRVRPVFEGVLADATRRAEGQILEFARLKIDQVIEREVRKMKK